MRYVLVLLSIFLFANSAFALQAKKHGYKTLVIQQISYNGGEIRKAPDVEMEQLQSAQDQMAKEFVNVIKEYVESKKMFEKVTTVATGAEDELVFQSKYNLIKVGVPILRGFRFLTLIPIGGGFEMKIAGRLVDHKGQILSMDEESENTGWYKGDTTTTLFKYNKALALHFAEWLESQAEGNLSKYRW